jgi:hypothetical protein
MPQGRHHFSCGHQLPFSLECATRKAAGWVTVATGHARCGCARVIVPLGRTERVDEAFSKFTFSGIGSSGAQCACGTAAALTTMQPGEHLRRVCDGPATVRCVFGASHFSEHDVCMQCQLTSTSSTPQQWLQNTMHLRQDVIESSYRQCTQLSFNATSTSSSPQQRMVVRYIDIHHLSF